MRAHTVLLTLTLAAPAATQQALSTTFGPTLGGLTGNKVAVGHDMDGDGVADLLVSSPGIRQGVVQVISGATYTVRLITNPGTSSFPYAVMLGTADLDLDGRGDVVLGVSGFLRAYSGATLTLLWQTSSQYYTATDVGDRNGDGRTDLAVVSSGSSPELRVISGADGNVLSLFPVSNTNTNALLSLGDLDGDSVPELARGLQGSIEVLRLANPPLLRSIPFPGGQLAAADFTGDGRNEIVASNLSTSDVNVLSATTGALLQHFPNVPVGTFAVIGDLNADGVPELALRADGANYNYNGNCDFVSGANGARLARWLATAQFQCREFASAGDLDGDGFGDLLFGDDSASATAASPSTGAWQLLSGKILATMSSQPASCTQGPFFPVLGITRPILGQVCTVAGQNAPSGTVGFVAFSPQPALPTSLGVVGCDAWFDLSNGVLLHQPTSMDWHFTFPVPACAELAGLAVALQAFYAPTQSAIGIDLTNGIWARLGY